MMMYADDANGYWPAPRDLKYTDPLTGDNNPIWSQLYSFYTQNEQGTSSIGIDDWFIVLPPYVDWKPLWQFGATPQSINSWITGPSIYLCRTASATPINLATDPAPTYCPTFNYGMNQRINYNLPGGTPETPFKISQAVNPSAFVAFSEQRVHASELPYYGTNPDDLSSTYNYTNRFSGRHSAGGNITFGDGHAAWFAYHYVCAAGAKDPKDPDINWEYDGK